MSIGIVPGFAKTDLHDGTDRYAQNQRISAVNYTVDDSSTIPQNSDTDTRYRSMQTISLTNISTSQVTITVLGSVDGHLTGGQEPFDRVTISASTVSVR